MSMPLMFTSKIGPIFVNALRFNKHIHLSIQLRVYEWCHDIICDLPSDPSPQCFIIDWTVANDSIDPFFVCTFTKLIEIASAVFCVQIVTSATLIYRPKYFLKDHKQKNETSSENESQGVDNFISKLDILNFVKKKDCSYFKKSSCAGV